MGNQLKEFYPLEILISDKSKLSDFDIDEEGIVGEILGDNN